jgi:sialic acid synthase SpsE
MALTQAIPKVVPSSLVEATEVLGDGASHQLVVLHCVSGYPALAEDNNLRTVPA